MGRKTRLKYLDQLLFVNFLLSKYLATLGLKVDKNMEQLPVMYWTPKMHKSPTGFRFIIASPTCSIKPLSKDITSIFKLFYKKSGTIPY